MFTGALNSILISVQTKTGFIIFIAQLRYNNWQKWAIAGKYRHSVNKLEKYFHIKKTTAVHIKEKYSTRSAN